MEITEFEKKRAANLIWNSAHDYTIETGFRVYDLDGKADVYWNSIIGAIHLHYDWKKLMLFYNTFHEKIEQGTYESLFWLAMENAAFLKEKDVRPVFPYLRSVYARKKVEELRGQISEDHAGQRLLAITLGHFRRAMGEDAGLPDLVDIHLLDEIEIGPELTTDEIIEHLTKTLEKYFIYRPTVGKDSLADKKTVNPFSLFSLFHRRPDRSQMLTPVRRMSFGYGEHVSEYGSEVLDQSHLSVAFASYTAQTDEGMKQYIEDCFGKSIYDPNSLRKLQKDYCYGNHTDVKLHITRGDYSEMAQGSKSYAVKIRKQAEEQCGSNTKAYGKNADLHRVQIEKLTARIRNSLLMHFDEQSVKSVTGKLRAVRVWRALYLNDGKVFDKVLPGDNGNITVDILLDASSSQMHRQETIAAQGYMIAQSLTNCGIPVRVYSFCSLNGYTIVNLFRDYNEVNANRNIFRYFASGANRDGLAIRLAVGMLKDNHADHRILITLSDCQPNDVIKVQTSPGVYKDYTAALGVEDTAAEVHKAKMDGIQVMCVFTGPDKALPNVHRIYDRDFARIRGLDQFADTVGLMLQNRIRNL